MRVSYKRECEHGLYAFRPSDTHVIISGLTVNFLIFFFLIVIFF